jgi:hypothetical protein
LGHLFWGRYCVTQLRCLFHNLSHKYDRQTLAGDNYHDQENDQFSYFPMGKIRKGKQSLKRRELVNGSEIRTFIHCFLMPEDEPIAPAPFKQNFACTCSVADP